MRPQCHFSVTLRVLRGKTQFAPIFAFASGGHPFHCITKVFPWYWRSCTPSWLDLSGTTPRELSVARWQADADGGDEILLGACTGPTLDVGCGPGRLVAALLARGVQALGVDVSREAIRRTTARVSLGTVCTGSLTSDTRP